MRKACLISAIASGVLFPILISGQVARNPEARWREIMHGTAQGDISFQSLDEARKIAEKFGETDPRLFETLVRLADFCDDESACEDNQPGYVNRALGMR